MCPNVREPSLANFLQKNNLEWNIQLRKFGHLIQTLVMKDHCISFLCNVFFDVGKNELKLLVIQKTKLNGNTLGQTQTNNIYQLITVRERTRYDH